MYKYEDIRNFYFENEKGVRIDCQKIDGNLFFFNAQGLGYEEEIEYEQVGNNFVPNKRKIKQSQIAGDLEFYNMTYDEYFSFMNFILQSKSLKIIYVPKMSDKKEYYRDIDFVYIDKTEEDDYNILPCPIMLNCKSLWYEKNEVVYTIEPQENEKRWDYRWDSRWIMYSNRSIIYNNQGHVEAPIQVEMSGYLENPTIQVIVDGEIYASITIPIILQEYEKLLYSSKTGEIYIKKQNTDGTTENLFKNDYINITNNNIFKLPLGVSEVRLTAVNEVLNAKLTIFPQYKAV